MAAWAVLDVDSAASAGGFLARSLHEQQLRRPAPSRENRFQPSRLLTPSPLPCSASKEEVGAVLGYIGGLPWLRQNRSLLVVDLG